MRVPVGEEPAAPQVAEVFLEPPQRPGAVRAEPEDVAANLGRLVADPVRLGEQVGVDQPDEVGEAVVVAVVRGGGQQEQVVGVARPASRRAGSAWSSRPRRRGAELLFV